MFTKYPLRVFRSWSMLAVLLLAFPSTAAARQWHDATGRFEVEAELVSANDELVVLRTDKGRLIALELRELSHEDRQFVAASVAARPAAKLADASAAKKDAAKKDAAKEDTAQEDTAKSPAEAAADADNALTVRPDDPVDDDQSDVTSAPEQGEHRWKLVNSISVSGEFFGFEFEPLIISRRLSKVHVGNTPIDELNEFYKSIIPLTVAHAERADIVTMDDLERWLRKGGAGPWEYPLESLVIETEEYGRVSIPLFLLEQETRESLEDVYQRWKLAYASQDPPEDRERYMGRERFLTRAAMAERAATALQYQVQLLRLEQLAANTNLTELWEVVIVPSGYGYPFHAVVPGRTSAEARQVAMAQYPGFTVGGVQKASW